MLIFVSAERRIFQLLGNILAVDVDRAGLRYVPRMPRIRELFGMLRGHTFASDGLLAVALAAFVLSEVFTSGSYLTGSNWGLCPGGGIDDGSARLATACPASRGDAGHGNHHGITVGRGSCRFCALTVTSATQM